LPAVRTAVKKSATGAAGLACCGQRKDRPLCPSCGSSEGLEIHTAELYREVHLACAAGMGKRGAALHFNILCETDDKTLACSVPPVYRRKAPIKRSKLGGFTEIIDASIDGDQDARRNQRHTSKRVFDHLRVEHGFTGGYTIIEDFMRERERRGREMFVPLAHPPGYARADFGKAVVIIARHCPRTDGGQWLSVGLQGPMKNLATSGFQRGPTSTFRAETRALRSSMRNGSLSMSASQTRLSRAETPVR
jgi:hypothetical protein